MSQFLLINNFSFALFSEVTTKNTVSFSIENVVMAFVLLNYKSKNENLI